MKKGLGTRLGLDLKEGQLGFDGAVGERESPRPPGCSRPIFASVMGYRRSLVDTCKSSSVLVVSTLVAFMYLLCFCLVFAINRLCNDELSLLHIMTRYDS